MARKPSKATKISKGYGRGNGKDYSAWEHANEHPNGANTGYGYGFASMTMWLILMSSIH